MMCCLSLAGTAGKRTGWADLTPETTTESPGWGSMWLGLTDGSEMLSCWPVPLFSASSSVGSGLVGVGVGFGGVPDGFGNMAE